MPPAASTPPTIRPATPSDIPAILTLLLTSFRTFSLFSFLYAPLDKDVAVARDTIFFWRLRLQLELLNPATRIIVIEAGDNCCAPTRTKPSAEQDDDVGAQVSPVEGQSWRLLEWAAENGLSQASTSLPGGGGKIILGFAIWKDRKGWNEPLHTTVKQSWGDWFRRSKIDWEKKIWSAVYPRRDLDLARYAAYLVAEEELEKEYYTESCYYLDNLCVDFRYQRQGLGRPMGEWGLDQARRLRLPVMTEAGEMGKGLYLKLGFEQIGTWKLRMVNGESEFMELPVMKYSTSGT